MAALPIHVGQIVERCSSRIYTAEELDTLDDLLRRLRDAVNPCAAEASDAAGPASPTTRA